MKKNLLKSLLLTLIAVFSAMTADAQCYIIGNDGNWLTNQAGAKLEATSTEGVYEGDVTFDEDCYYFFVATKLMEESDDWQGLRNYRYNPTQHYLVNVVYNEPSKLANPNEGIDGSFRVADTGVHHITVNFNEKTVTVNGTYPEYIYILGSDGNWQTNNASAALSRVTGTDIFSKEVTFTSQWFAFFTTISEKEDDWDFVNANRWAFNGKIKPNTITYAVKAPEATSEIERLGKYMVTFNYTDKTFELYDPEYNPDEKKSVYFVGDANSWQTNTCFAKLEENEENIYSGEVELSQYFTIATALTADEDDWENFNNNRWGPAADATEVGENSVTDMYNTSTAFLINQDGNYDVKVDLNTNKLYINKLISTGISSATMVDVTTPQPYYDLTGRCLGTKKPAKGIYIKNGRKMVVE